MRKSHHTGVSTFTSHTIPSTEQSLQKSLHLSHPDKIELKKISFPSENKKYATTQPNDRQKSVTMQTPKSLIVKHLNYSVDRRPACNRRLAQWRVKWLIQHSTSHQPLWCIDSFELRNPPLRQAPKR